MKRLTQLSVMVGLILFGGMIEAATLSDFRTVPLESSSKVESQPCALLLGNANDFSKEELALEITKRGCCSHHKGVCGCGGTKLQCCDGTLSPSCKCMVPNVEVEPILKDVSGPGIKG
jgi:hypothetical protein